MAVSTCDCISDSASDRQWSCICFQKRAACIITAERCFRAPTASWSASTAHSAISWSLLHCLSLEVKELMLANASCRFFRIAFSASRASSRFCLSFAAFFSASSSSNILNLMNFVVKPFTTDLKLGAPISEMALSSCCSRSWRLAFASSSLSWCSLISCSSCFISSSSLIRFFLSSSTLLAWIFLACWVFSSASITFFSSATNSWCSSSAAFSISPASLDTEESVSRAISSRLSRRYP